MSDRDTRKEERGIHGIGGIGVTDPRKAPRLMGYVQLRIGDSVVALPVQAVPLRHDGGAENAGGFFTDREGEYGILVDSDGSESEVRAQIDRAIADAVAHISRRMLN